LTTKAKAQLEGPANDIRTQNQAVPLKEHQEMVSTDEVPWLDMDVVSKLWT